jgi:hypothetical protein
MIFVSDMVFLSDEDWLTDYKDGSGNLIPASHFENEPASRSIPGWDRVLVDASEKELRANLEVIGRLSFRLIGTHPRR